MSAYNIKDAFTYSSIFTYDGTSITGSACNADFNDTGFGKHLIINSDGMFAEIPVCAMAVRQVLFDSLYIPLLGLCALSTDRADCMIRYLFSGNTRTRLLRVENSKGIIYYGTKGIILDKDWNILFLGTLNISQDDLPNTPLEANVYINSKVFLNQDKPVEKVIIKKMIPYYLENTVVTKIAWSCSPKTLKPNVIITDDFSRFIAESSKPSANFSNTDVNKFLLEHFTEII